MNMEFKYEVVKIGSKPSLHPNSCFAFANPVSCGDQIRLPVCSSREEIKTQLVVSVEHHVGHSVLYVD
jgi:hypothetical protein